MMMPDQPNYRSKVLDHLGLVSGMFDELGIGDVIDRVTQQNPEMRDLTVGEAVKAMVLNGLGFVNQALYLVPQFFHNKPTHPLFSRPISADQLNDDALGRALDTLYAHGVTELYSLIAIHAAERLGLVPRFAHLDSTSFHVDGTYNSDQEPDEKVVHITRGYSRDHRPDLNQVMLELIVEHQAGIPILMKPLNGNSSDVQDFGEIVRTHVSQLQTTYGLTYLVADSALYREDNLNKLAQTPMKWITRVPATLREAQAALAQANPQRMAQLQEGYRYRELASTYGGVAQRWLLIFSEHRQSQAQRRIDKQLRKQSDQEAKAFKKLCQTPFACASDAKQALAAFERGLQATFVSTSDVCATACYGKRGRPGQGAQPEHIVYHIEGGLAASLTARQERIDQGCCFILASNELDAVQFPPQEILQGYKGQSHAERSFRFLKDPQFLAASLYLKKPERIMALLMVMTLCLLVYAALEYRIRTALQDHDATFPDQKGKPTQSPTARWVFHYFVGIHVLIIPGQWPVVLNLDESHQNLLRLLGKPYMQFYGVKNS
jgi:transposase